LLPFSFIACQGATTHPDQYIILLCFPID
jgi:hypothetical protein